MITPQRAFELIRHALSPVESEARALADAPGAVLREVALAATDLPPFDQSAMDGYALAAADLDAAQGRRLPVEGVSAAAPSEARPTLQGGTTMRIFTGGMVPTGADTVVPQEDVEVGEGVAGFGEVRAGACIRKQGEEVRARDVLLEPGARLDAGRIAALAMAGIERVVVTRPLRVACFVGGDEIVSAGTTLGPGQVYDANGPLLRAFLEREDLSFSVDRLPDDLEQTKRAIDAALRGHDLVLTTGGVSVGERDFVVPAARALGLDERFWKIAQKPGKPLYCATRGPAMLIGFPGNPGAVFAGLSIVGRLAIDALSGHAKPGPRWRTGVLRESVRRPRGRDLWLRVQTDVDADGLVGLTPLPRQASHMLSNLARCDALAWVPTGEGPIAAGTRVPWCATR